MCDVAAERLGAAGLRRYEISSWARRLRVASQHAIRTAATTSASVPARTRFCTAPVPRRWWNLRLPHRWREAVAAHGIATDGEELLSDAEARADFVITGLRRLAGADVVEFERRFTVAVRAAFPQLAHLEQDGLVEIRSSYLRLTPRGLRFADTVGACLV